MVCPDCKINMNEDAAQVFPYDSIKRSWWRCPHCGKQEITEDNL